MKKWPVHQQDYRSVKNPKLFTRNILVWAYNEGLNEITSDMVANHFNIGRAEAASRLSILRKWGCIKPVNKGKKPLIYEITERGIRKAKEYRSKVNKKWLCKKGVRHER